MAGRRRNEMRYNLKICALARKHHQESSRAFAHTLHHDGIVCITPEIYELPEGYFLGILLHEFGHIALKDERHTEDQADKIMALLTGIQIERKTYRGMKNLEWIRRADRLKAVDFLRRRYLT
jgi:hypothetical protein